MGLDATLGLLRSSWAEGMMCVLGALSRFGGVVDALSDLRLLGGGNPVSLAVADCHPVEVMDLSSSVHLLAPKFLAENHPKLVPRLAGLPAWLDTLIAGIFLKTRGVTIDERAEK